MWSCNKSLVTVAFLWEKPQFYKDLTGKIAFSEEWSWFKFNNLGLELGTNFKFCTSLAKWLKLKVRTFWGSNPTFVEVTGEKLVGAGGLFGHPPPPILNRVRDRKEKRHFLRKQRNTSNEYHVIPENYADLYLYIQRTWIVGSLVTQW